MASDHLRKRLYDFLSDGQWMPREDVIRFVSEVVPPAVALRARKNRLEYRRQRHWENHPDARRHREGLRDPEVVKQIAIGQRNVAYRYVYNWTKAGILETVDYQGEPWVKLARPLKRGLGIPRELEGS